LAAVSCVIMCPTEPAVTNEWTKPEHAEAYLARMTDIPHRADGEATLLSEIPRQSKRILDLGCGNGHLLSLVLAHCPGATGVTLDFSATMLGQARERFDGDDRVTFVEHNMDDPLPHIGLFDCVVSSFAIHHCTHARKRQLYSEVFSLLEPGGVFCNLEHVSSPTQELHARFIEAMGALQRNAMAHKLRASETSGATLAFSSMARWKVSRHIPILSPYTSLMIAHAAPRDTGKAVLGASYDHRLLSGFDVIQVLQALIKPPA